MCLTRTGDDLLVMLHEPRSGAAGDTAVLLCPPFGWQQDCSYRGLRAWATELARAGHTAARVTLPSTGDSAGTPRDPRRLEAWTDAVSDAARWLRRSSGAARVVAIGIGLGGMVCYRAAAAGAMIDELVLWAVPARGAALVRELRGHHQIIAASFPDDVREEPRDGDLGLIGYTMTEETAGALADLRLTSLGMARVPRRVLMLGRDGIGPDAKLAEHLTQRGCQVESADGHDYAELMANPQQSLAPRRTIDLTMAWLARGAAATEVPNSHQAVVDVSSPGVPEEAEALGCTDHGVALRETPIWFDGVRGRIFGVLTEPVGRERAPVCTVLLGAGALPHTGPNRSWVDLSRTWAARGVASLRIDVAGVGESDGEDPELVEDESLYGHWRDREIAAILDQLRQRGVADQFVLGGLCSGAYRSLRRALIDPRVRGLLLLNLYAFKWSNELVKERGRRVAIAHGVPGARGHALNREFLAKSMAYARPDRAWRLLRRAAEREQERVVIRALDQLRDRGVQTLLVLGADEPLLAQFRRQGLTGRLSEWPNLVLDQLPSSDHMYRAGWLQRQVYATLDAGVERTVAAVRSEPGVPAGIG